MRRPLTLLSQRLRCSRCPSRRALFVGASPLTGDPDDLQPALEVAMTDGEFSMSRFAEHGYPLIHPLWLLRGLSNNVLGFASAAFDLQGVNANYCDGARGGWTAIVEGARAVAEGRADLAIAGGADSFVGAEAFFAGRSCGEGAAFIVFAPADPGAPPLVLDQDALDTEEAELGMLGAATWPWRDNMGSQGWLRALLTCSQRFVRVRSSQISF